MAPSSHRTPSPGTTGSFVLPGWSGGLSPDNRILGVQVESSTEPDAGAGEYVLGLMADPGVPARIAHWLADGDRLPGRLYQGTEDRWRVEVVEKELELDPDGNLPIFEAKPSMMSERRWDAAVLVTDLPRRAELVPILADYSTRNRVGMLSAPALGAFGVRRRALRAVSHMVAEHLNPHHRASQQLAEDEDDVPKPGRPTDEESSQARHIRAPLGHIPSSEEGIDEHIALLGVRGRVRLLAGMVRANRPWALLPSLSPAMAGAGAGAAFGVFYSNVWMLADASSLLRLTMVAVLAVAAMILWLVAAHGMWERRSELGSREHVAIANTATLATVSVAVVSTYVLLFFATLVAALVVIPASHMESSVSHAVGLADYAGLALLATSMGIIAGALGSGLADEETVKRAAYSRREYQRRQQREERGEGETAG